MTPDFIVWLQKEVVAGLGEQMESEEVAAPTGRLKERGRKEEDENFVESRLSRNIISQARKQVVTAIHQVL